MNNSLISIIIPFYNASRYIPDTIESVSNQSLKNWEIVFINDASTDRSKKIIEKYCKKEPRAKLINFNNNCGPAIARNKGIREAKGQYIAFLDSDDLWLPTKLEKQIAFMQTNNLSLTYSSYYTIDDNEKLLNTRIAKDTITYTDMLKSNYIGNLTGIYDASKLGKVYMENIGHEDYTLWLKIMKKVGTTQGIQEPLAKYRVQTKSISSNKLKALKWQWTIYKDIVNLSLPQRIYYIGCYAYHAVKKRIQ